MSSMTHHNSDTVSPDLRRSHAAALVVEGNLHRRLRLCTGLLMLLTACGPTPSEEITSRKPYADLIGTKYIVVADDLYAYGVYESAANKTLSFVELLPIQIEGREIAFKKRVPKGQLIKIISAWRHFVLLESGVYYLVKLENSDLPEGVPVRLELARGNDAAGQLLNPDIYRRLSVKN